MSSSVDKKFASFKFLIFLYYFICADCLLMLVQGQQLSIKEDCWWTSTIIQSFNLLFKVFICTSQLLAHVQSQQFSIEKDCWWTCFRIDFKILFYPSFFYSQSSLFFYLVEICFWSYGNFFFFFNFNNFLLNSVNST